MSRRRSTTTSNFGVGARESHDSSPFYDRFRSPEISTDDRVPAPQPVGEPFVCGDARHMDRIADGSVALVVTSPPYFAGKQYEEEFAARGRAVVVPRVPRHAHATCSPSACGSSSPGGRIAVNVANLGRKPYRSLSADVIRILEHDLGLLLRGELIWQKAEGASGSCAWGSFRSAANPVLRDVTERVIVASKGRFDRARSPKQRAAEGLPYESTLMTDDFMALTLDVWSIPPESARRVGHPGPVPGRTPRAAHPALHVRATTSCSTRSWAAVRRSSPRRGSVAATSDTTSTRSTSRSPSVAWRTRPRKCCAAP